MRTLRQLIKTIFKYRLSSALTLASLVVAFLGIIVLSLYVSYEKSFDGFHKNGDDIYLMTFNIENGTTMPAPMAELVMSEVPEVKSSMIMNEYWSSKLLYTPEQSRKDAIKVNIISSSAGFFTMFDFPLITGDPATALSAPNTIVISETLSKNIFGTTDVMGKSLMAGRTSLKVSGVCKDIPENSAFKNDAFVSLIPEENSDWSEWSYSLFFQLKKGTDKAVVERKIEKIELISKYIDHFNQQDSNDAVAIDLMLLEKLHYDSRGYHFPYVNKRVLDVLSLLILVLIIMGAVNFINFSTSQAPLRAKSLSIQQILGEKRWKAKFQIIGEAVLLSITALSVSLIIHRLAYQRLENLFQIDGLSFQGREIYYVGFILFAVLFGVIAALYPSRYITSAPISQAVKGKMFFSGKGRNFRSVLITTQFIFTIALIIASLTIEKQLRFWNNFDIGIDKENVLYLETTGKLKKSHESFVNELIKNPDITDYAYTQFLPGDVKMGWGREIEGQQIQIKAWPVSDRFIEFFGIEMAQGRKFRQGEADVNNVILNEKAVQQFGWNNPLERKFPGIGFEGEIVGVSKNFNFASLKEEIVPMMLWCTNTRDDIILIKTKAGNYKQLKEFIETTAKKFDPESTFDVRFLDDSLEQLYSKENRMARFIEFVSIWTILLALTGLLGLIIFISRDKTKEIGIRKVNGASIFEIVKMLNKSVLIWLTIAFIIAAPISFYAMNKWLENFTYKTSLSWWIFAVAGLVSFVVALLTVSWQSYVAAKSNPVEALRNE